MTESENNVQNENLTGSKKITKQELIRMIKFGFVGGANTLVDFIFKGITQMWVGVALSQVIGYSAGVINSYIMNRTITFKDRKTDNILKEIIPFLIINLISLGISVAMDVWLENGLGLHWILAKLIILPVTLVINYVGSKFLVFRGGEENKPQK